MTENNQFDYTVTKKVEGKYKTNRILMIIGYVIFAAVYFFGLAAIHMYPLMALIIFFEWMLIFFTWRYVSIEYKYETVSGNIKFYNVYGGKKKKLVLDMRIKDFKSIVPLNEENKKRIEEQSFEKTYSFVRSDRDDTDKYYATFDDSNGDKCIVYFEATQAALKIFKFYNSSTQITDTRY